MTQPSGPLETFTVKQLQIRQLEINKPSWFYGESQLKYIFTSYSCHETLLKTNFQGWKVTQVLDLRKNVDVLYLNTILYFLLHDTYLTTKATSYNLKTT